MQEEPSAAEGPASEEELLLLQLEEEARLEQEQADQEEQEQPPVEAEEEELLLSTVGPAQNAASRLDAAAPTSSFQLEQRQKMVLRTDAIGLSSTPSAPANSTPFFRPAISLPRFAPSSSSASRPATTVQEDEDDDDDFAAFRL